MQKIKKVNLRKMVRLVKQQKARHEIKENKKLRTIENKIKYKCNNDNKD